MVSVGFFLWKVRKVTLDYGPNYGQFFGGASALPADPIGFIGEAPLCVTLVEEFAVDPTAGSVKAVSGLRRQPGD